MPRTNGTTLRGWRRSRGWDVPEMARRLREAATGAGQPGHDSVVRRIRSLEAGEHAISERYELLYATALGISVDLLAQGPSAKPAGLTLPGRLVTGENESITDWPAWFGLKLAQMVTLTDTWRPSDGLDALQILLDQEITMSDAVISAGEQAETVRAVARRQALLTLAALPAAAAGGWPPGAADNTFLARCAASLTACWHLLKGSDLAAVEQILAGYLLPLEAASIQVGPDQRTAAMLAAQAHRISGIISLHRQQLLVREQHCRRALRYAEMASDASSHASALISLASTWFYAGDPKAAVLVYEQAGAYGTALPQLQRSRVQAELAVVYAQLGREDDSVRAIGRAGELYPDRPEADPSYLYAEFTRGSLALEQGLAYVALADTFSGRGYQRKASSVFSAALEPGLAVPQRIRCEITGQQAATAVLAGDLDAFAKYFDLGVDGAIALSSRQRLRELVTIWQRAAERWPGERRVLALGEHLRDVTAPRASLDG